MNATTLEFVRNLSLAQILASPFNPRGVASLANESINELADSIRQVGILQPIVVRPALYPQNQSLDESRNEPQYEIVAGHRRVAAAELAGLTTIPAIVTAATDSELKTAHLIENIQRENLQALEEASGYARLRDDEDLTVEQIAARIGKKPGVVYNRLKLLELCDQARDALASGLIGAEVGVIIARIGPKKLQVKALADAVEKNYKGDPKSFREIRDVLIEKYTLALKGALFDPEDVTLLPNAGACSTCVKRSGGDPHLFSDILERPTKYNHQGGDQVCTDPDCFAGKKQAHLARAADRLAERGKTVVTGAEAAKALKHSYDNKLSIKGRDFLDVAEVRAELKAIAADKKPKPVTLMDPKTGKTREAFRRKDLVAAGVKVSEVAGPLESYAREEKRRKEEQKRVAATTAAETTSRRRILDAVRAKVRTTARSAFDLQLVARAAYAGVDYHAVKVLAELWGEQNRDDVEKRFGSMSLEDLNLFVMDCALVNDTQVDGYALRRGKQQADTSLHQAARHYGIDVDQFKVEVPAEPEAEAVKPAKKKGKVSKLTRRLRMCGPVDKGDLEDGDLEEALADAVAE